MAQHSGVAARLQRLVLLLGACILATGEELKLGYLYIQTWSSWVVESFSQFKLGIQDVNADPDILPNTTLRFVVADSGGKEPQALSGAIDLVGQGVVGIVGTGYSSALGFPAGYCSVHNVPIVSPGSTLIDLSEKTRYPFLMRSISSDAVELKAMVVTVYDLGWRAVALIYMTDVMGALTGSLRPAMDSLGIRYTALPIKHFTDPEFEASTNMVSGVIASSGYRVTLLYLLDDAIAELEASARRAGLRSAKHNWVMISWNFGRLPEIWSETPDTVFTFSEADATANPVLEAFNTRWPTVSTLYNQSVHGAYNESTHDPVWGDSTYMSTVWDTDYATVGDGQPDFWGKYVYDTVWLYAHAIQAVMDAGGDPRDGSALRMKLLEQTFLGITGELQFDQDSQDRTKQLVIRMKTSEGIATVAKVTSLLSQGSPSDEGWCRSGCTTLNTISLADLPWSAGSQPSDGNDPDMLESSVDVGSRFEQGDTIEVKVKIRNSFKQVPCLEPCTTNRSSTECSACFGFEKVAFYFNFFETAGSQHMNGADNRSIIDGVQIPGAGDGIEVDDDSFAKVIEPDIVELDVIQGEMVAQFVGGLPGSGVEDRSVVLTVFYDGEVVIGGVSRSIALSTTACPMGYMGEIPNCQICDAGSYSPAPGSVACTLCPAGKEQMEQGKSSCNDCAPGRESVVSGSRGCRFCDVGTYQSQTGSSAPCLKCDPGKYSEGGPPGTTECLDCPAGTFAPERGAVQCSLCGAGKYQNQSGFSECIECAPGTYSEDADSGNPTCTDCLPGYFLAEEGGTECAICPRATYSSRRAKECVACDGILPGSSTELLGASSEALCTCPTDFFWHKSGPLAPPRCEPCPDGLECTTGNAPPLQAEGFQAGAQAYAGSSPSFRVHCGSLANCPGGTRLESCPSLREGTACDKCPVGYSDDGDGGCSDCSSGSSIMPLVLCVGLAAFFMVLLSIYATRTLSVQSHALLTVALSGSLFITAFQTLAVFHQLRVDWIEPMKSLKKVMALLTFDVEFLKLDCIFRSNSPGIKYLCSLMVYPSFALLLFGVLGVLHLLSRKLGWRRTVTRYQVWNAQGNVVMIIYPSLAMMSLMPMRCGRNPDGSASLISERSILCWDSDAHWLMISLSLAAIAVYIVAFIAFVTWVVIVYPKKIAHGGAAFVRQYEFLFKRFRQDRYGYALIFVLRNLFMALVPALISDEPALQIILMSSLLIMIFGAACYLVPWRTGMANFLDALIATGLIIILVSGALMAPIDLGSVQVTMQVIMMTLIVMIFGVTLVFVVWNLYVFFFPPKRYGVFLSHHKGAAQLLARWFKQRLRDRTSDDIFLDSDNLDELFSLLHTVAFETKNLVVLLTAETLNRLWCACEIVAATRHKVNIVLVYCDGTELPTDSHLSQLEEAWTEAQKAELADVGVEVGHIAEAYRDLHGRPTATMPQEGLSLDILDDVVLKCSNLSGVRRGGAADSQGSEQKLDILIVGNVIEMETACCCQIVQRLIMQKTHQVVQIGGEAELESQLQSADDLVLVLRRGALADFTVAAAVVHAMNFDMSAIPLLADGAFRFPDENFWNHLQSGKVIAKKDHALLAGVTLSEVAQAYKTFFKIIAVKFTEYGSETIQSAEISEVISRLGRNASRRNRRSAASAQAVGGAAKVPPVFHQSPRPALHADASRHDQEEDDRTDLESDYSFVN